ncbi:guanine deaminase [Limoniibacter endophyticus]|uniref:Guanine deaminase n=1 Tax=Limoniibacter endophyticus TaxID=1565040 RepID=A0A8J3DG63_9HYPH|nr:guanine deaminase [Limoniibacter endophyticus]GHC63870.1 guanine deaminase [Limoniibacter endophyticus]
MNDTVIRGRLLAFHRRPEHAQDHDAYVYEENGAIRIRDGRVMSTGSFEALGPLPDGILVQDHRPYLLMPGFIDCHAHFPQVQIIGSFGAELLDWLNEYTFPAELAYGDPVHARTMAAAFLDSLIRNGTTSVAAFCSVHPQSVQAFFEAAHTRNMATVAGKVMMDRNAPAGLLDTAQRGYDETLALIEDWHGRGRQSVAITPRFAITSTPAQLEAASALKELYPECPVQTHLSENLDEIRLAANLYPQDEDYLGVYQRYGLLGERTLLGHSIHLSPREIATLVESRSVAVFCPTSNLFLGSGLFDYKRNQARNMRIATATDIGGGTSYSMLKTMDEAYKIVALQGPKLSPLESFWQITRGNAEALSLDSELGTLETGTYADIVVLNASATPEMALRMQRAQTLSEELFVLQTMGDDRAVAEVYLAGSAAKSAMS